MEGNGGRRRRQPDGNSWRPRRCSTVCTGRKEGDGLSPPVRGGWSGRGFWWRREGADRGAEIYTRRRRLTVDWRVHGQEGGRQHPTGREGRRCYVSEPRRRRFGTGRTSVLREKRQASRGRVRLPGVRRKTRSAAWSHACREGRGSSSL
jgi:hypothetical protein